MQYALVLIKRDHSQETKQKYKAFRNSEIREERYQLQIANQLKDRQLESTRPALKPHFFMIKSNGKCFLNFLMLH